MFSPPSPHRTPRRASGWMIGVLIDLEDGPSAVRHFFAVAQPDRSRAEWAASDQALLIGSIATRPALGMEPVQAVAAIPAAILQRFGLPEGRIRALGTRWPRTWISLSADEQDVDPRTHKG